MIRLAQLAPVPCIDLARWTSDQTASWDDLASRAAALGRGAGVGRNFSALMVELRGLLVQGDSTVLSERLDDRRSVRAVVTLWLDDPALARTTMTTDLLDRLVRARPSRLATITFTMLFFEHFDQLDTWRPGLFLAAREFLRTAVTEQPLRSTRDVIDTLRSYGTFLLELDGPRRLAAELVAADLDVTEWFRGTQMSAYADGRFGRSVRDAYYLALIRAADAEGSDHPFLSSVTQEVLARQRTETTDVDGLFFGHEVLGALTAKQTRRPSEGWLRAVLEIGGDPRLQQTSRWRLWWSKVPADHLARAVRWMRGVDLRAFLDGVEQYALATGNADLLRMVERRKRFLLGLYEQDRVEDVRLVLGSDIRRWISASTPFALQDVAALEDNSKQDTAIVYLDCGEFCLVEGSHNFKLHAYIGGPLEELADRRTRRYTSAQLRVALPASHQRSEGEGTHFSVSHQGFEWLRHALDFLDGYGIVLDERGLMTSNDYAELERRRARGWY